MRTLVMLAARSRAEFAANAQLSRIACRLVAADGSIDFRAAHVDAPTPAAAQMITALQRIEATIATVRASADAIGVVSDDMAQGSSDLSARTVRTGGHLQHAAQAMTQLGGTVQSASNAAGQADEVARSAFAVARQGGDVVKQVVTTMGDIQAASRRIADIIGVVDGLAFQTNILALNAGVEAARAGEHGRGFAVVAAEVRSLARRSADAAHEIKSLIGANVERVETGTALVNQAGATVQDIVGNVQQVHHIVGEIAAASAAQRSDIGAVTGTMAQLGAMTQQNAALVQQSAAAVDSLRAQSARLTEAVRLFRLGAAAAAPAATRVAEAVAEPPGVRQAA